MRAKKQKPKLLRNRKVCSIIIFGDYMTTLYIVRHCESMGNVTHTFQGVTNSDITKTGAKQLKFLKKRFKNVHFDKIYTSPLLRAQKTALAIIGKRDMVSIIENGLMEIDGGVLDGLRMMDVFKKYPDFKKIWDSRPQDLEFAGGEKMRDVYERIYDCVLKIANENENKTVVLVMHGGLIRCLMARLMYGSVDSLLKASWSDNTAVTKLTLDNGKMMVDYFNDYSHLPKRLLPEKSRFSSFLGEE